MRVWHVWFHAGKQCSGIYLSLSDHICIALGSAGSSNAIHISSLPLYSIRRWNKTLRVYYSAKYWATDGFISPEVDSARSRRHLNPVDVAVLETFDVCVTNMVIANRSVVDRTEANPPVIQDLDIFVRTMSILQSAGLYFILVSPWERNSDGQTPRNMFY